MSDSGSTRWRPAAQARLHHACWDGEWVCHHALSNDTHRLSGFAGRVLMALAGCTVQDAAALAAGLGVDEDRVTEVLHALESLDFIERCP